MSDPQWIDVAMIGFLCFMVGLVIGFKLSEWCWRGGGG